MQLDNLDDLKQPEDLTAYLHEWAACAIPDRAEAIGHLFANIVLKLRRLTADHDRLLTAVKRINATLEEAGYHEKPEGG